MKIYIKRENIMRKRIKDERGAIVVEATISFTTFIFLLYIIYSIVDICYIQAKDEHSVKQCGDRYLAVLLSVL